MYFAARPLSIGLSHYPYPNNHLLNTFLEHITTSILGHDPWAIRLPAFLAGVLIIPLAYLVIRRIYDRDSALLGAAFIAASSQLIEYSSNARGFSIQTLCILGLILVALHLMRNGGSLGWFLFVGISAISFYAIPTALYYFSGIALWLFLSSLFKDTVDKPGAFILKLLFSCFCTAIVVFLLYLPVIISSGWSSVTSNEWVKALPVSDFLKSVPKSLVEYSTAWNTDFTIAISIIIAAGFLASLLFYKRMARTRINLSYPLLFSCILIATLQRRLPPARILLPLLPLYLGFASAGLVFIGTKTVGYLKKKTEFKLSFRVMPIIALVVALGLGLVVLFSQSPYQPKDQLCFRDAEGVTLFLKSELKKGDIIYIEPNTRKPLEYYFVLNGLPQTYMYRYPEDLGKEYKDIERAFVVDAYGEGESYNLDAALNSSNLTRGSSLMIKLVARFPHSDIYIIENPPIEY
ncbi:MAG: glycosyltransferase family 39 protein [Actinobacteria bacterium]|nr:glycosyltransferase family 39 protein [Actinomycetota bacterium]